MNTRGNWTVLVGALALLLASGASAQTAKPVGETKLVIDFEDAAIWMSENDSPFETAAEHVTQGRKSLRVHYTNKPQWSNVYTAKPPLTDWSGFRYLNFDVYWEDKLPGDFGMWIRDKALHKAEASTPLGNGWNTVTVDLDELQKTAELDRANVTSLCLYKEVEQEVVCHIDNMYLSKERPVVPKAEPVRMPDAELLTNGGFEMLKAPDELGSPFAWWISRRWQGASFLGRGTRAVFSGTSSAMLDGRGPCKIGWYTPPIEVKSPTKLKLTAYVQAKDLQKGLWGQFGSITLTDVGERGLPGASVNLPEGTYAWKKVELVADVPAKCPYVKVFIQLYGPGQVWVDEMSLTGVDLAAATGSKLADTGRPLVADPPLVTEDPVVLAKKRLAQRSMKQLEAAVAQAKAKGVETLYDEIPLMLGQLAFDVRWDLPEHLALRRGYADTVYRRCEEAKRHLRQVMAGAAPNLEVPPHPDFAKLKLKGRYYSDGDEPKILFSMQYHRAGELIKWFCPEGYADWIAAVGASRYDVQQTPVWEAYQKYPDTHRVYDDGWCGHIIRDKYSAGGAGRCVISLDSPDMLKAIAESIATVYAPKVKNRRTPALYLNMGFEYSYVNYDKYSGEKFRKWLERKYGTVAELNKVWKTDLKTLNDVTMPSYHWATPENNPAKYHDWGEFNLWRFTDFMKWAKSEMLKHVPGALTTTGGGEPFGAGFWRQGIDEEALMNEGVCDIWLSETGSRALGVTSVMDLQRSLTAEPKLILDPEYHARPNTCFLMFLHGCGVMDYWWWPSSLPGEFYDSSMKHSQLLTLPEVEAVMETALDVRRMAKVIAPFPDAKASIALLYPRASLIQKFPAAEGHKTPYTIEVERTYGAAVRLDTPVGFASSKRIREDVLKEFKVLVVPGARYVNAEVWEKIKQWVTGGGTLVVTPTSLVADEYLRKRNYLNEIGIEILAEELPEFMAGEAKRGIDQSGELDFIQGPVAKTIITKQPTRTLLKTGEPMTRPVPMFLKAEGVIQTVKASKEWDVRRKCVETGDPAMLVRPFGKGRIYYMAAQFDIPSRKIFFDHLMGRLAFDRPIRALTPAGDFPEGVESRTVSRRGDCLTYLHNETGEEKTVKLAAKGKQFAEIFNLNTEEKVPSATMTLAPYETRILRIRLR
ncbi:MAG TPA: beta-galactosidase trimerization domain-containing protein [Planctomycetota bacterium]|nr:beta-galactosidase trimerization domain-containing protein [Planctomycetota bacterium]